MSSLLMLLPLLLIGPFQTAQDPIRQHSEAAEGFRRAGQLDAAESEYTAVLAEGYRRLGKALSSQQDHAAAVPVLESASRYRADSDVLVDLAIAYYNGDQYRKALATLEKALAANPQSVDVHHMLGKTSFMLGNFTRSTEELEIALKLAPDDYDIAYTLGLSYLKQHRLSPAREIYDRLVAR